jgi:hypothetical protein
MTRRDGDDSDSIEALMEAMDSLTRAGSKRAKRKGAEEVLRQIALSRLSLYLCAGDLDAVKFVLERSDSQVKKRKGGRKAPCARTPRRGEARDRAK